ncbi:hypothetical protein EDD16DRAFT_1541616 [Pisolithus croceorrhizus]|nr:hypothetical protein EDD16DRAFT_1541616 [Pisolithus croceorrhizus]KAI6163142.1 hypothetical protein EDD17DRAFT_1571394 [Pisolithus thermaeus]
MGRGAFDREVGMAQQAPADKDQDKDTQSDECDDIELSRPPPVAFHIHADNDDEALVVIEENSQAPPKARQSRLSQQPSPECLASLGIKVRDFAYESTLPPINPVPRIPRQVQPEPLPKKQTLTQWVEGTSQDQGGSSQSQPHSQRLERKATEPLDKESLQYARALRQTSPTVTHLPTRPIVQVYALPSLPVTPPPIGSPTSPLTPLSQETSQESKFVQTPSPIKFATNDVEIVTASQTEDSQPNAAPCQQSIPPSLLSVSLTRSQPLLPCPSLCVPRDLVVESQPTSTPRRRRIRPVTITDGEVPSSNRYQLRRRPSSRSRRPQPYPVTSTATGMTKKNSTNGQHPHRTRQGPVR